jgi:tyrosinase
MRLTTLFLLANLVTSSILPTGVMAESPWIRKNAADLTSAEWTLFKDAWSTVAANGFLQGLLDIHSLSSFDHHGYSDPNAPRFLPWHRVFLAVFEKELHDFNGTTIPYWDWNSYREGNLVGNPLVDHSSDPDWGIWNFPHDVSRGPFVSSLPSSAMYDTMYQRPVYWDGSLASSFATQLQSLHDSVHVYVGGNMGGISTAPSDPIYWMHHAFVDKT